MWKATTLWTATFGGLLALAQPQDNDSDGHELGQQLGLELTELERQPPPDESVQARVAELTGGEAQDLSEARFYRASTATGTVWLCELWSPSGSKTVVCTSPEGAVLGGAVLAADGSAEDWRRLFVQLQTNAPITLETARSHAALATRSEEASRGTSAEDRLTSALIGQRRGMVRILALFGACAEKLQSGQPAADELEAVAAEFDTYAHLGEALASLLGEKASEYARHADATAALLREAAAADRAGESPMDAVRETRASCGACHELAVVGGADPLREHASALRSDLGVGDGYLLLGFDLVGMGDDRAREQAVATDVRRALLLLSEVRP